jgi:hypothetical protein
LRFKGRRPTGLGGQILQLLRYRGLLDRLEAASTGPSPAPRDRRTTTVPRGSAELSGGQLRIGDERTMERTLCGQVAPVRRVLLLVVGAPQSQCGRSSCPSGQAVKNASAWERNDTPG